MALTLNHPVFMPSRFTVLPDERFAALHSALDDRIETAAKMLNASNFSLFLDSLMKATLLEAFSRAGAHEGTAWLLDAPRTNLVAAFNSGPNASQLVGNFSQPTSSGMISLVVASEQPICENEVYKNSLQDKTLDRKLELTTCAMLAVPFYFARQVRGVISCVQLKPAGSESVEPCGFSMANLASLQLAAGILSRLVDHRLLALTVGRENP